MSRTSTYLLALNSTICGFFILRFYFLSHFLSDTRTVRNDVVQGSARFRQVWKPELLEDWGFEDLRLGIYGIDDFWD